MRKFSTLLIMTALWLASCSTPQYYKGVNFLDYSVFKANNIFVTESNSTTFEYEAKGHISIVELSGYQKGKEIKSKQLSPYDEKKYEMTYLSVDYTELCKPLCDKVKEVGGDGIINLMIIDIPATSNNGSGIKLSGMVIKRKKYQHNN
ncbi:hypothetical protein HMPREF1214_02840 [Bacteroides sp. HPS0048]|uniref:hypothetical protein n=1 Tax=Bacteroides sp. HPS0048 TaxID=1078089 RepID=UPI00035C4882|nr:hypothetical protein [Bacteroides sp. HPS0048]EOA57326.1 hypothetical protein HMPREF1214_02840 [Bacteroides sp. HPS0048]